MKLPGSVHFVGIGGIGMSAAAKLLAAKGMAVTGSDAKRSTITEALEAQGIIVFEFQTATNVPEGAELIVYSSAVPMDNPERSRARALGIREQSYFELLGDLSKEYTTIVVTGTNGKSTTTAMLGLILEAAGMDPTVIVGSLVPGFKTGNLRVGNGNYFVVEGCEHHANILHLHPEKAIITNIEEDHLDYYRNLDHIVETFQTFADKLTGKGSVVWNANDPASRRLKIDKPVSFGMNGADYQMRDRKTVTGAQSFVLLKGDAALGEISLKVPGEFNAMNAMAASAMAMELGVSFDVCARTLAGFTGIWRRFERVGSFKGADVISDYGHHPTAIKGTVAAAREFFPGRRIVLCFQPHQHSRTKELLEEFVDAVPSADVTIVPEIFAVLGRTEKEADEVSSQDIVDAAQHLQPEKNIRYAADLATAEAILREIVREGDVVLVMGAGDVDSIARNLA